MISSTSGHRSQHREARKGDHHPHAEASLPLLGQVLRQGRQHTAAARLVCLQLLCASLNIINTRTVYKSVSAASTVRKTLPTSTCSSFSSACSDARCVARTRHRKPFHHHLQRRSCRQHGYVVDGGEACIFSLPAHQAGMAKCFSACADQYRKLVPKLMADIQAQMKQS